MEEKHGRVAMCLSGVVVGLFEFLVILKFSGFVLKSKLCAKIFAEKTLNQRTYNLQSRYPNHFKTKTRTPND